MSTIEQNYYIFSFVCAILTIVCIVAAYYLHHSKDLTVARLYRPNHIIEHSYSTTTSSSNVHFDKANKQEQHIVLEVNNGLMPTNATEEGAIEQLDKDRTPSLFRFPRVTQLLQFEGCEDNTLLTVKPAAVLSLAITKMAFICFGVLPVFSSLCVALVCYMGGNIQDEFARHNSRCQELDAIRCVHYSQCKLSEFEICTAAKQELPFSFEELSFRNIPSGSNLASVVDMMLLFHTLLIFAVTIKMMRSLNIYRRKVLKYQLQHSPLHRTVDVSGFDEALEPIRVKALLEHLSSLSTFPNGKFSDICLEDHVRDNFDTTSRAAVMMKSIAVFGARTKERKHLYSGEKYMKYLASIDDLRAAYLLEKHYHENIIAQRQIAYKLLDEGLVRDPAGGLVCYQKETDLPPLMHRSPWLMHNNYYFMLYSLICKTPLIARTQDSLRKEAAALNDFIVKGETEKHEQHAFLVFGDALSAYEFVARFNTAYGGMFSSLTAKISEAPYRPIDNPNQHSNGNTETSLSLFFICGLTLLVVLWGICVDLNSSRGGGSNIQLFGTTDVEWIRKLFGWYVWVPISAIFILSPWFAVIRPKRLLFLGSNASWSTQKKYDNAFAHPSGYCELELLPQIVMGVIGYFCVYFAPLLQLLIGIYTLSSYVVSRAFVLDGYERLPNAHDQRNSPLGRFTWGIFFFFEMSIVLGLVIRLRFAERPIFIAATLFVSLALLFIIILNEVRNRVTLEGVKGLLGDVSNGALCTHATESSSDNIVANCESPRNLNKKTFQPTSNTSSNTCIDQELVQFVSLAPAAIDDPASLHTTGGTEKIIKNLMEAQPFAELCDLLTSPVDVEMDITEAASNHTVTMKWHSEDAQRLMHLKRQDINEVEGLRLARSIAQHQSQ